MKIKTMAINAVIAALYLAVTALIAPFGFTNIQFRVSEVFNHLVVFNKKYIIGVVLGVFISNLLLSTLGWYDLTFGVAHSLISLTITIVACTFIKGTIQRMIANTLIFTFTMFIIAIELKLALGLPFWFGWMTLAVSEFIVMAIGIPIMHALGKRIDFRRLIED
ncbi:QueT transporter family protein [Bhargavaea cecembensis]|uniref:QueT transporter family protein n=1 Tax=Bhargavaea cecembensis TaxID=394098 RepID=UPI00059113EE|nr:QueT transporter family protein [Bhargavaea cecembensis]